MLTYQQEIEKMIYQQYLQFHIQLPQNRLEQSFLDEILGMRILLYDVFSDHIKMSDIQMMNEIEENGVQWSFDEKGRKIPIYKGNRIKAILINTPMDLDSITKWLS